MRSGFHSHKEQVRHRAKLLRKRQALSTGNCCYCRKGQRGDERGDGGDGGGRCVSEDESRAADL